MKKRPTKNTRPKISAESKKVKRSIAIAVDFCIDIFFEKHK